jgi:serine/threonine protein phosphatase PrpC
MGTYLAKPVTDKCHESGESTTTSHGDDLEIPVRWSVVDMQGWRKSMEDGHVAATSVPIPLVVATNDSQPEAPNVPSISARVFGVFDGHGGPEVARFCSLYLVSVLQQQSTWFYDPSKVASAGNNSTNDIDNFSDDSAIGKALISSFHALDRMIDDPSRRYA